MSKIQRKISDILYTCFGKEWKALVEEFTHIEKQFLLKQWKYSELNGGRFCELAARLIYSKDSGNSSPTKSVDDCLNYVTNEKVTHAFPLRKSAIHLVRLIRAVYKLRSDRGGVHVSPYFEADEIDSKIILEGCRWIMAEFIRVFGSSNSENILTALDEITRFQIPIVRDFNGRVLIQRVDLNTEEEILFLLYNKKDDGAKRKVINETIPKNPSSISRALKALTDSRKRQVVKIGETYQITDLGIARTEALVD